MTLSFTGCAMANATEVRIHELLVQRLAEKSADPEVKAAATRAATLATKFRTATTAGNVAAADAAALELENLKTDLATLKSAETRTKGEATRIGLSIAGLFAVTGGFIWFLYSYGKAVGLESLGTIEGTRPLLVIGAILSTIVFGGSLLIGSLFSNEGSFEDRFRHAREVFLVFSGIFGTVIGFYFGAGDRKPEALSVSQQVNDSVLAAHAVGGTGPYKITLTYGSNPCAATAESKTGWAAFRLDKTSENILDAKVSVVDAKGGQSSSRSLVNDANSLKADGWYLPEKSKCSIEIKPSP